MELYSEYIKEREGVALITKEHGFVTYKCVDNECFIHDLFVSKEHRGGPALLEIIQELGKIAVVNGCSHLSGILRANDPGINRTMKAALKLGFRILNIQNNGVIITKELKGDLWVE
jgi:hypothetical protein